ncbi:AAA family ATPase [Clostridioides sp. ZZV14-6154]|uniref:AAA family ATPase n=1 Tax=unclassified Clostridioides TaxID=2635829 RepID=UPI001D113077|nr:AAA family ATPase [Clostridioides sp. ZZV14-6154]MCC0744846.1 AAA family ATPase [Clostridioides sp. ZZV14-6044]
MITSIFLDFDNFNEYTLDRIDNLSKVNIFVGANNSGKSRFLRTIFNLNSFNYTSDIVNLSYINNVIMDMKKKVMKSLTGVDSETDLNDKQYTFNYPDGSILAETYRLINSLEVKKSLLLNEDNFQQIKTLFDKIQILREKLDKEIEMLAKIEKLPRETFNELYKTLGYNINKNEIRDEDYYAKKLYELKEVISIFNESSLHIEKSIKEDCNYKRIYIPSLRGLRNLFTNNSNDKCTDIYYEVTKSNYFKESLCDDCEIFTGINLYNEVQKLLLGSLSNRKHIREFEQFLGNSFFENKEVTLIPKYNEKDLWVKIGDEEEQPIYSLGDGIQSIIILTFTLFKYRDKNILLFIEEPELFLHPGFQRKLINIFNDEMFNTCQVFFTTHSNHFLDITLDTDKISVYRFNKVMGEKNNFGEIRPLFNIENSLNKENSILSDLGASNSSMLLSNCTIWVEGITDRLYIKKYLQLYQNYKKKEDEFFKVFDEDIHYSFVEYSGGNITHWNFVEDINNNLRSADKINASKMFNKIFLILDDDGGKKQSRKEELKNQLKDNYYCLNCREVENLLSKKILLKVISEYEDKDKEVNNLEFTQEFNEEDYKNVYLGRFIQDNLKNKKRAGTYSAQSGTVSDKLNFCKKAVKYIEDYDCLTEDAVLLCEKIYEFIKKCNH